MNGAALDRLAAPADLDGVVRDRGPEVRPPLRLAVIAVRARIGEDVDAAVPDLDRQRVGVRVRGDGQESVRPAVAATPYLRGVSRVRSEDGYAGIRETGRARVGPAATPGRASAPEHRAAARCPHPARPPATSRAAEQRVAERKQRRPAVVLGSVEQYAPAPRRNRPAAAAASARRRARPCTSAMAHSSRQVASLSGCPPPPPRQPRRTRARPRTRGSPRPAPG